MKKLFGTDGIRSEAGKFPLDETTIQKIGESLARRVSERIGRPSKIVSGRDTRESGPWIERAFIAGATRYGAEVASAGIITTPGIAFLARSLPADAGVVISASHNPYKDNGIKIFTASGRKLDDATEKKIEADITGGQFEKFLVTDDASSGFPARADALRDLYLRYLRHDVARDVALQGLKMVVDCANGAASELAPR